MPIMITYRLPGLTPEAYDSVRQSVGWEQRPPAGAIFHIIAFDETGGVEVDAWEDRATFDAYVEGRLGPVLREKGIEIPPPEIAPTHNLAVGDLAKGYLLTPVA